MNLIGPQYTFRRNLRDVPRALTLASILSGLVVVIIGYTSPLIIVIQAANAAKLSPALTSSWVFAVAVGAGIGSLIMSLYFRQPLLGAWPTAGAALLVIALPNYAYSDAIGAFLLVGVALTVIGLSGLFTRVMAVFPRPVVLGMLGGVLFRFGTGVFGALPDRPLLIVAMLATYFILQRLKYRTPTIGALVVGVIIAALSGDIHLQGFVPALATPIFTAPTFTLQAALGIGLPLLTVNLVSQYAPGLAVLNVNGYKPPLDRALIITGLLSIAFGVFGAHGIVLAAITAAITAMPEAHPDPTKRYVAATANGVWYIAAGVFGATAIALFAGLPSALIAAISGIALVPTLVTCISGSMADPDGREGGLVALLCTAANVTFLGIGAAFWGLLAGIFVNALLTYNRKPQ